MNVKYILIDKCERTAFSGDLTYLASLLGACDDTLAKRLPYWEDADWILMTYTYVPSKRGRKRKVKA